MYKVLLQPSAQKSLSQLPRGLQTRIIRKLESLESDPLPPDAKKLKGEDAWRVRVGDYRILYEIRGNELIVLVVKIGHRREINR